ncbi:protein Turandot M-like [Drosophila takahashii]|uniref:protein Turandot M-like n=1 Tax=Drosophila takahashii TaxID=29030 RepID=UPI001CF813B6|nr:protein Turandot M-like [Drosophila takahashii]
MNPTIFFGCLLVLTGCLLGRGNAEGDDEFTIEKQRLLHVYGNSTVSEATRFRNVDELVNFYDKYSSSLVLPNHFKERAEDIFKRYKEQNSRAVQVDGVPAQGGFWKPLLKYLIVQLGVELASEGIKRATES